MDMVVQVYCISEIYLIFIYKPDINECDEDKGGCSHRCTNTEGSFECSCNDGYILDSDRRNCLPDIIPCDEDNGGCSQRCNNTEGSFECSCYDGYILDSDGRNCLGKFSEMC